MLSVHRLFPRWWYHGVYCSWTMTSNLIPLRFHAFLQIARHIKLAFLIQLHQWLSLTDPNICHTITIGFVPHLHMWENLCSSITPSSYCNISPIREFQEVPRFPSIVCITPTTSKAPVRVGRFAVLNTVCTPNEVHTRIIQCSSTIALLE